MSNDHFIVVDTDELSLRLLSTLLNCSWVTSSSSSSTAPVDAKERTPSTTSCDDDDDTTIQDCLAASSHNNGEEMSRKSSAVADVNLLTVGKGKKFTSRPSRHAHRSEEDDSLQRVLSTATNLLPAVGPAFRWEHLSIVLRRYLLDTTYQHDEQFDGVAGEEELRGSSAAPPPLPAASILADVKYKLMRLSSQKHFFILHRRQLDGLLLRLLAMPTQSQTGAGENVGGALMMDVVEPLPLPFLAPHAHSNHYVLVRRRLTTTDDANCHDVQRINDLLQEAQDALFPAAPLPSKLTSVLPSLDHAVDAPASKSVFRRTYPVLTLLASMRPIDATVPEELLKSLLPSQTPATTTARSEDEENEEHLLTPTHSTSHLFEDEKSAIDYDGDPTIKFEADEGSITVDVPSAASRHQHHQHQRHHHNITISTSSTRILILNPMLCYGAIKAQIAAVHLHNHNHKQHAQVAASTGDDAPMGMTQRDHGEEEGGCAALLLPNSVLSPSHQSTLSAPSIVLSRTLVEMMFWRVGVHNLRPWKKFIAACPEVAGLMDVRLARTAAAIAGHDLVIASSNEREIIPPEGLLLYPRLGNRGSDSHHTNGATTTTSRNNSGSSNASRPKLNASSSNSSSHNSHNSSGVLLWDDVRRLKQLALEMLQAACRVEAQLLSPMEEEPSLSPPQ